MARPPRPPSPLDLLGAVPTSSEDQAVAALAKLWRDKAGGKQPRTDGLYSAARSHLAQQEKRQRRDDAITASLLDKVAQRAPGPAAPTAAVQQTVRVQAQAGELAVVQFVVANPRRTPATVRFRPSELVRDDGDAWWAPVRLTPARPTLAPGEECTARLELDLRGCPWPAPAQASLALDVEVADALAMKLWIELRMLGG
jgi:hypothetical protein